MPRCLRPSPKVISPSVRIPKSWGVQHARQFLWDSTSDSIWSGSVSIIVASPTLSPSVPRHVPSFFCFYLALQIVFFWVLSQPLTSRILANYFFRPSLSFQKYVCQSVYLYKCIHMLWFDAVYSPNMILGSPHHQQYSRVLAGSRAITKNCGQ